MTDFSHRYPVPDFTLPSSAGGSLELSSLRRRRPAVLVFLPTLSDTARAYLLTYAEAIADFEEYNAAVFAIVPVTPEEAQEASAGLPFPILADADGQVHHRYFGKPTPAVFMLDRYNAPRMWRIEEDVSALLPALEAADEIRGAELSCSL